MPSNAEMVARLALAGVMGSIVGFERERLLWAAGLRTHMLVCVGACLIMLVSAFGFADVLGQEHIVLDPSRVAAQVVSGIGFLGAGTILLRGEVVKGLTTAASLWAVAAIGLAVGGGLYVPAIATTAMVIAILAGVKPIEERWRDRMQTRSLRLVVRQGEMSIDVLHAVTGERASRVKQFLVRPAGADGDGGGDDHVRAPLADERGRHRRQAAGPSWGGARRAALGNGARANRKRPAGAGGGSREA